MNSQKVHILNTLKPELVQMIECTNPFLTYLECNDVLTRSQKKEIRSLEIEGTTIQVGKVIDILVTKPNGWEILLKALDYDEQDDVMEILKEHDENNRETHSSTSTDLHRPTMSDAFEQAFIRNVDSFFGPFSIRGQPSRNDGNGRSSAPQRSIKPKQSPAPTSASTNALMMAKQKARTASLVVGDKGCNIGKLALAVEKNVAGRQLLKDLKAFARHLELDGVKLERIMKSEQDDGEKLIELLETWRIQNANRATLGKLLLMLKDYGANEIADCLEKKFTVEV